MDYQKANGYKITPYDMNGVQCYAIRDGKIGCLIRNSKNTPLIFASEDVALGVAKSIPPCSKLNNFSVKVV